MMRLKLGLMVGFAAGYYFGTKAGRERYDQIHGWIGSLTDRDNRPGVEPWTAPTATPPTSRLQDIPA